MRPAITYSAIFVLLLAMHAAPAWCQYPNIRINYSGFTTPEEVTIAINPANPMNLSAGANISFYYYSTNGGSTWVQGQLNSTYGVWGDPCVAFDADGRLFYGHLSNPVGGYWIDRIVVQKSTDGGQSWDAGTGVGYNPPVRVQDKEWLAVDLTASPYRNNVYMAWTEFDSYGSSNPADSSRIRFARTTDHGATWSAPVRISDRGGDCIDEDNTVEGAVPAVGPNGEVYLSWSGPLGIMFDRSTDGGVTWGTDIFVTSQPGGWDFTIPGIYRANGMPVTACDISNSPYGGTIYIQWSDQRNGVDDTDVLLAKSTDGGTTWSSPLRVNSDSPGRHQFFSWMSVDPITGYLYVVYYDRRHSADSSTHVFVAKSTNGGETFTEFKVSETAFTPRPGVFFGDYTNIAARNGKIYPIWMRMDGTALSVWTAIINDAATINASVRPGWNLISVPLHHDESDPDSVYPTAISSAFGYWGGYHVRDTLSVGSGYWLKFPSGESFEFTGSPLLAETVDVHPGWNLIGSISVPLPVSSIASDPPGMVVTGFYGFDPDSGYSVKDTIQPGKGYWMRMSEPGKVILASGGSMIPRNAIVVSNDGELPPDPPRYASMPDLPAAYSLEQNFPNPFNPSTTIRYQLPAETMVSLRVYNVLGEEVRTLVRGVQGAGVKTILFDAGELAGGIYYYRIRTEGWSAVGKMVLVK